MKAGVIDANGRGHGPLLQVPTSVGAAHGRDGAAGSLDCEVLVLGGGSVGLAAAAALSEAGFAVQLIERASPPPGLAQLATNAELDARVYALSPASVALLQRLGAWPAIAGLRAAPYQAMQVWQGEPVQALRFAAQDGGTLGHIIEHSLLNAALWALPGQGPRHTQAVLADVQLEEGRVQAQLADGRLFTAKLLVVADGPASPWPAQLGLPALAFDYPQRALVCHARFAHPHGGVARQRFLPGGPLALLPLADGRASIVWSCAPEQAAELLALDDAAFALRLATASQQVLGPVQALTRRLSFDMRFKRLSTPVAEAAVVLGDAAHVVHPLAGQGVNLGLADAAQLAATLAEARAAGRGWWRLRTLQAYARARAPEVDEMLALTDALHRGFSQGGPALARALGLGMHALDRLPLLPGMLASRALR